MGAAFVASEQLARIQVLVVFWGLQEAWRGTFTRENALRRKLAAEMIWVVSQPETNLFVTVLSRLAAAFLPAQAPDPQNHLEMYLATLLYSAVVCLIAYRLRSFWFEPELSRW
jgi:hypothetical protein